MTFKRWTGLCQTSRGRGDVREYPTVSWTLGLMPGFRFAVPFFRSVAIVAVARENGNAGKVFPYT